MKFSVLKRRAVCPTEESKRAFLLSDRWDDGFSWNTQYDLIFIDENHVRRDIGSVKIGMFGMKPKTDPEASNRPPIPLHFEQLDVSFFSIGQSDHYYETLNEIGAEYCLVLK